MNQQEQVRIICHLHAVSAQLDAVIYMVEKKEQPNKQILLKIGAIQRALRLIHCSLVACQIWESITLIQNNPNPETQKNELMRIQELY